MIVCSPFTPDSITPPTHLSMSICNVRKGNGEDWKFHLLNAVG